MFFKKDELKKENNVQVIYFNTKNTFMVKNVPLLEDGTVRIGSKTWKVSDTSPYFEINKSMFDKKATPTYILTNDSAIPYKFEYEKTELNPLILNELLEFKALKKMMDFKITKEGSISGSNTSMIKFVALALLLVVGWFLIRYVWLGAGT